MMITVEAGPTLWGRVMIISSGRGGQQPPEGAQMLLNPEEDN